MSLAEWWAALATVGFSQPTWPSGLGGREFGPAEARTVMGALAAAEVIGPPTGNGPAMGGPTILRHGTPEQRQRLVGPLADGQSSWCQLFSEPGAGSDLASLACQADRDGDELVISGQKVWNSFADQADLGMLLIRTNVDAPKHRGITFVMIDMAQPGVEVRPLVQMTGNAEFCEVFLTEARARVDDVIGGIDEGWTVAKTTLAHERASAASGRTRIATIAAGPLPGNLDRSVGELLDEAANRRRREPRRDTLLSARSMIQIARAAGRTGDPIMRQRLADYHARLEVYRLTNLRSRANAKAGRVGPEGSVGKLALAGLAHQSRDLSLGLLGADGMLADDGPERGRYHQAALNSFIPSIGGGTNEIQRNIIGERTLGLPREPGATDEIPFKDLPR